MKKISDWLIKITLVCMILVITTVSMQVDAMAAIIVGASSQSSYQSIGYCSYDDLNCSKLLVDKFVKEMKEDAGAKILFNYSDKSAWEQDMKPGSWSNDSIDDVNFMIYCGHGVKKGAKSHTYNSLHYFTQNSFTDYHFDDNASEKSGSSNLTTAEARWGAGNSKTRWVALFSCNFMNEDDIYCNYMMQGINICMGFSSTMYVFAYQGLEFGDDIANGAEIIKSFLETSDNFQSDKKKSDVVAKVIYAEEAKNDTIYDYAYTNSKPSPIGGSTKYYSLERLCPKIRSGY